MTGATGLVGRALCAELARDGQAFSVLSRDPARAKQVVPGAQSYHAWQPLERGSPWAELMAGARAVVHLASPLTGHGRWNDARRQELYDNCVMGTHGIVSAIAEAKRRPKVLICASSVAYYAFDARGVRHSGETDTAGEDYLSRLAEAWEGAAMHADTFGVRTVVLRSALVVAPEGAVRRLRLTARLGISGPVAPGSQRQPWIHLADEVGLLRLALDDERVVGPLNAVSPHLVTSAEFMDTLCTLLGRTTGMAQPTWLLRTRFGAGAMAVTQGRGALPERALELGYEFHHNHLDAALSNVLTAAA